MTNDQPAAASIIANVQDLNIKDLIWILLELLDLLTKRGIRIAVDPRQHKLTVYRRPAQLLGVAQRVEGGPPFWTQEVTTTTHPTLPLRPA